MITDSCSVFHLKNKTKVGIPVPIALCALPTPKPRGGKGLNTDLEKIGYRYCERNKVRIKINA